MSKKVYRGFIPETNEYKEWEAGDPIPEGVQGDTIVVVIPGNDGGGAGQELKKEWPSTVTNLSFYSWDVDEPEEKEEPEEPETEEGKKEEKESPFVLKAEIKSLPENEFYWVSFLVNNKSFHAVEMRFKTKDLFDYLPLRYNWNQINDIQRAGDEWIIWIPPRRTGFVEFKDRIAMYGVSQKKKLIDDYVQEFIDLTENEAKKLKGKVNGNGSQAENNDERYKKQPLDRLGTYVAILESSLDDRPLIQGLSDKAGTWVHLVGSDFKDRPLIQGVSDEMMATWVKLVDSKLEEYKDTNETEGGGSSGTWKQPTELVKVNGEDKTNGTDNSDSDSN